MHICTVVAYSKDPRRKKCGKGKYQQKTMSYCFNIERNEKRNKKIIVFSLSVASIKLKYCTVTVSYVLITVTLYLFTL